LYGDFSHTFCMGIYLSYILYGDFSHTFCMGISLIHFVWDSTFFLLKSGPSSGTGKAPIAEGRALLEVEVLQYRSMIALVLPYDSTTRYRTQQTCPRITCSQLDPQKT